MGEGFFGKQVEPIPGIKALHRREQYHEYLFRRRMWDKRFAVAKQFKSGVDAYEIWLTDFVDDMSDVIIAKTISVVPR